MFAKARDRHTGKDKAGHNHSGNKINDITSIQQNKDNNSSDSVFNNYLHNHSHNNSISNLKTAFLVNLGFTVLEFFGGIYTNSIAIIADSLHDLGDSVSLGISWVLEKYSKKGRTKKYSYGYQRFSLLSALINSVILIIGSIFVLYKAIPRLLKPELSDYKGMLLLAVIGVLVNGYAVLKLKKGHSINERVALWHLLEDVFGWVAVLIISLINLVKELPILDPILAMIFTIVILYNITKNLKQIIAIFMQATPSAIDFDEVKKQIMAIPGVLYIHDVHLWTLDNQHHVLTMHLVVKKNLSYSEMMDIKCKTRRITSNFNIRHVTVEIEHENESCEYRDC